MRECSAQLQLARDLKALARLIALEATGGSMEALYPCVPESLRGRVELVYDLQNRAAFRLFEELLYADYPCDSSRESWMFFRGQPDGRPFAINTPRLDAAGGLHVNLPFRDPAVDQVFALLPQPFEELADQLGVERGSELLRGLVTTDPPPPPVSPPAGAFRWRYLGHAAVLFETPDIVVLTDPAVSTVPGPDRQFRYTLEDLPPRIDYVVITHGHWDHVQLETLLRLRHRIGTAIVPRTRSGVLEDPSLKLALRSIGFPNVRELDVLKTLEIPGGSITALPFLGEHADLDIGGKAGYLIELRGRRAALVADAANLEPMLYERVARLLGPVDLLFVGMECEGAPMSWLYGPLLFKPMSREQDRSRRLAGSNAAQAVAMAAALGCREAYVYALGREPWMSHLMRVGGGDDLVDRQISVFIDLCAARGIRAEALSGSREGYMEERNG